MSLLAGTADLLRRLTGELDNFEQIAQYLLPQPGDLPRLQGIDIFGGTRALNGTIGGDHLIYVDFKRRFNLQARIDEAVARGRFDVAEQLQRCQRMAVERKKKLRTWKSNCARLRHFNSNCANR